VSDEALSNEAHARSGPVADEFSSKISLVRIR
jgi:hypothetical protein